jgi:hypothetical protein
MSTLQWEYDHDPRRDKASGICAHRPLSPGLSPISDRSIDVLRNPGEDRPGREGSRIALGQTRDGRYIRVIYVPDPGPESVFVITAYELTGKPLTAYRRRRHRKGQR